jgi:hypothetical protein
MSSKNSKSTLVRLFLLSAIIALFSLASAHPLLADTFTYDVTLVPGNGYTIGGTGVITLNGAAPAALGTTEYTAASGALQNITFSIDGQNFSLAGAAAGSKVDFTNGVLTAITFSEEIGNNPYKGARFDLQTSGVYAFYYNDEQSQSDGTFTATAVASTSASAVPEPSSLAFMGSGLLAAAGALRRRLFVS